MPISLETINQLYNINLSEEEMDAFIENRKIKIEEIKTSEDIVLSQAGRDIYEKRGGVSLRPFFLYRFRRLSGVALWVYAFFP